MQEEKLPYFRKIDVVCSTCGKEFKKTPYAFKSSKNHYCSEECRRIGVKKQLAVVAKQKRQANMIKCDYCGKEFYRCPADRQPHNYCCQDCFAKSQIKAETVDENFSFIRKCPICGKEFRARPGGKRQGYQKYCSLVCKYEADRRINQERREREVNATCEICGKKYRVKPRLLKTTRFCSKECQDKGHGDDIRGEKNIRWKGPDETRKCKHCGKEFTVRPNRSKRFCSISCHAIYSMVNEKQPTNGTIPEQLVANELERNNIRYEKQVSIKGRFVVDFLVEDKKVIIEALGDWWHLNPTMFDISQYPKQREKRWRRERRRLGWFIKHGYTVFGIWESDLKKDAQKACRSVIDYLLNGQVPDKYGFEYLYL